MNSFAGMLTMCSKFLKNIEIQLLMRRIGNGRNLEQPKTNGTMKLKKFDKNTIWESQFLHLMLVDKPLKRVELCFAQSQGQS